MINGFRTAIVATPWARLTHDSAGQRPRSDLVLPSMGGVLEGVRIVELAGLAPAPFAAMMLADHGAHVVRIERAGEAPPVPVEFDILRRGRAEILSLDLKDPVDVERVRALAGGADGLIEGFRPGA